MASLNQNATVFKNRKNVLRIAVNGVPNLAGWGIRWAMTDGQDVLDNILLEKNLTGDDIWVEDLIYIYVKINEGDATEIPAGNYYHEIMLVDLNGKPFQATVGVINLRDVRLIND